MPVILVAALGHSFDSLIKSTLLALLSQFQLTYLFRGLIIPRSNDRIARVTKSSTHADENEAIRKWKTKSGGHGERGILSVGKKTCTRTGQAGRKKRERIPMDTENYEPREREGRMLRGPWTREKYDSGVKCAKNVRSRKKKI